MFDILLVLYIILDTATFYCFSKLLVVRTTFISENTEFYILFYCHRFKIFGFYVLNSFMDMKFYLVWKQILAKIEGWFTIFLRYRYFLTKHCVNILVQYWSYYRIFSTLNAFMKNIFNKIEIYLDSSIFYDVCNK